ncbi:MAG: phosphoribosylglycinamide formyltransferase [Rickettsiales bacterium]
MTNLAIFISGRGTNMQSIIEYCKTGAIEAKVALVFSNKADAKGLEIAKAHNIKTEIIEHQKFSSRAAYDFAVVELLKKYNLDIICMAGYMRLVTEIFLDNIDIPILNIHPSLLPKYKGANAVEDAFKAGENIFGCTVHHVIKEMDAGEIIIQKMVKVAKHDNLAAIKNKILAQEHLAYKEALNLIIKNNAFKKKIVKN